MICNEKSSCGVGLLASLDQKPSHENLKKALKALKNLEHRGGSNFTHKSGDGAGIMVDIPWSFFGYEKEQVAIATLFLPKKEKRRGEVLRTFENIFLNFGLEVLEYREVPIDNEEIAEDAAASAPVIKQAFIKRPHNCRTLSSFDRLLYSAKQMTRSSLFRDNNPHDFFFASLSCRTIVYKALTNSLQLPLFYKDLQNPNFKIKFALFHRRFSTNTVSTWDKVQPFRLIAHNGEINTINGNRSWAITREKSLGLRKEELIAHTQTSDSGSFNGMVEALKYRSSNHKLAEIISFLVPPARQKSNYYKFWSRAMEPWDGPALIGFCDGKMIGAHLDRNGFRPCRWGYTKDLFVLSSEAGSFEISGNEFIKKGSLSAGETIVINTTNGKMLFDDIDILEDYSDDLFNPRLKVLKYSEPKQPIPENINQKHLLFGYSKEDLTKFIGPMSKEGKEAIGSMGDTASLAALSQKKRSLFDFFYQDFAQVTNPPLDYIRESLVTDMSCYLCRKPNIFEPRELLPPPAGIEVDGPILSLGMMEEILSQEKQFKIKVINTTFNREDHLIGMKSALSRVSKECVEAIRYGTQIVVLSDREASPTHPPLDSLLVLRKIQLELNRRGIRMRSSLICDSGDVRNAHQLSVLVGNGATAVCPWLAMETIRQSSGLDEERNFLKALRSGLLRIMAKVGISVLRSYQGSGLFTPIGIGPKLTEEFFPNFESIIGGIEENHIIDRILSNAQSAEENSELENFFLFKEFPKETKGEVHSITNQTAKNVHSYLDGKEEKYNYKEVPVNIRDLLHVDYSKKLQKDDSHPSKKDILTRFGSGAMSFGAISAEAQKDIIIAMDSIGGRSNSGEGGENPYYWTEGISSTIKQIASGRFGVTAEYLRNGKEIQLKMAQGAKPGEGGQLMKKKVSEDIAKARFTDKGIDLISPPPMHDIYSIEDLKQLIFELKQLHPKAKVSVKLVSGKNIGNISVGVVKAGADIIQISGGEGGTGAASLLSMKHCGLPWEIGLNEVHKTLVKNKIRNRVELRVDGGIRSGKDIIVAACLGAEGYDFGKMILIAQGCIMARVCEKNTCPAGIATHDEKFKKRYNGSADKIVKLLDYIACEAVKELELLGLNSLGELIGETKYLKQNPLYKDTLRERNINLNFILNNSPKNLSTDTKDTEKTSKQKPTTLNLEITKKYFENLPLEFQLKSTDRAVGVHLMGELAEKSIQLRKENKTKASPTQNSLFNFKGCAGQGFGAFLQEGIEFRLDGEANDFVGKSMSGGVIRISSSYHTSIEDPIIGNTCFYGATGGKAFIQGSAGDRFAIRNSGLTATVGSVGYHACEYMTGGKIIILGKSGLNLGAGMTGGVIYSQLDLSTKINKDFIEQQLLNAEDKMFLEETLSQMNELNFSLERFYKYIPKTSE